jgi:hypothetical protein
VKTKSPMVDDERLAAIPGGCSGLGEVKAGSPLKCRKTLALKRAECIAKPKALTKGDQVVVYALNTK